MALNITPSNGAPRPERSHRFTERTLAEVAAAIETLDEAGKAGGTYRYRNVRYDASGSVLSLDLDVQLVLRMPVWAHYAGRPQAERDEWDRFYHALCYHEDGHLRITRTEVAAMYQALLGATEDTLDAVFAEEEQRIKDEHDAYDDRTDHGLTQQTPHGTTVIQVP